MFEEIRNAAKEVKAVIGLCAMTGLNRAGYYRFRLPRKGTPVAMEVRDEMQKIALQSPSYGYRRITAELQRRHFAVNHERVLRLIGEDNLLCIRRHAFVITTHHGIFFPCIPTCA